ncbi:GNAT family N-acetyltransferase [Streptoalloteichus tenebrarius]|nr:GNAT family protein [Streptoalloteichus tenebrarius]
MRLVGSRVALREFRADDLDDSMAVVGDDRVTKWLSFDSLSREEQSARLTAAIQRAQHHPRTEFYLAVTRLDDDRLIGFCRLGLGEARAGKLGVAIAADHHGQGYATDASRAMVDFGFCQLGLHRITATIGPENTVSLRVIEKLGFTLEGRLRDHVFTNGSWRDSLLYSMLEDDWRQLGQAQSAAKPGD